MLNSALYFNVNKEREREKKSERNEESGWTKSILLQGGQRSNRGAIKFEKQSGKSDIRANFTDNRTFQVDASTQTQQQHPLDSSCSYEWLSTVIQLLAVVSLVSYYFRFLFWFISLLCAISHSSTLASGVSECVCAYAPALREVFIVSFTAYSVLISCSFLFSHFSSRIFVTVFFCFAFFQFFVIRDPLSWHNYTGIGYELVRSFTCVCVCDACICRCFFCLLCCSCWLVSRAIVHKL